MVLRWNKHSRQGVGFLSALVVGSLAGRNGGAEDVADILLNLDAGAACKSANDQGHGAKRSVGAGGGLDAWGGRWL